jgi:prefoldin subunit 5
MCENCAVFEEQIRKLQAEIAALNEELDKAEMQKACAANDIRMQAGIIDGYARLIEEYAVGKDMEKVISFARQLHNPLNRIIESIGKELLTFSPRQ